MTRIAKCESCRARKVKCDETWPECLVCKKKGRKCTYIKSRDDGFIHEHGASASPEPSSIRNSTSTGKSDALEPRTLLVKRSRAAKVGEGKFITFTCSKAVLTENESLDSCSDSHPNEQSSGNQENEHRQSISRSLSSHKGLLATRMVSTIGTTPFESSPMSVFGSWMQQLPARLSKSDSYVDFAASYALDSIGHYRRGQDASEKSCWSSAQLALQSLRNALETVNGDESRVDILISVMWHYIAEYFRSVGSWNYVPHTVAVARMARTYTSKDESYALVQSIANFAFEDEVTEAILNDRNSYYDNLSMPTIAFSSDPNLDEISTAVRELSVRIPRLVRLVRAALADPSNRRSVASAVRLAKTLYKPDCADEIQRVLKSKREVVPTTSKEFEKSAMPQSFKFQSVQAYVTTTQYYLGRLQTSALVQNLCNVDPKAFSRTAAELEDVASAYSMAMCAQYALDDNFQPPIPALKLLIPIEMSFGSWHRLERRQEISSTNLAPAMKDLILEVTHKINELWNVHTKVERLIRVTNEAAGCPYDASLNIHRPE